MTETLTAPRSDYSLVGATHNAAICFAASTIFGASGVIQLIISRAKGAGASGKVIFLTYAPCTACAASAMT